jgi:hypothetical protein
MDALELRLPEGMKTWLAQEAARAGLATPADFVVELLRQEQERSAFAEELEGALQEAIANPSPPIPFTPQFWEELEPQIQQRQEELRRAVP